MNYTYLIPIHSCNPSSISERTRTFSLEIHFVTLSIEHFLVLLSALQEFEAITLMQIFLHSIQSLTIVWRHQNSGIFFSPRYSITLIVNVKKFSLKYTRVSTHFEVPQEWNFSQCNLEFCFLSAGIATKNVKYNGVSVKDFHSPGIFQFFLQPCKTK